MSEKVNYVRTLFCSNTKLAGLLCRVLVVLPLCAAFMHGDVRAQDQIEIEAFGQAYEHAKPVGNSKTRLTIYRLLGGVGPAAVTVYLDARYHTSLLPGGYIEACVKPATIEVGMRPVDGVGTDRGPLSLTALDAQGGQQQFLRVTEQPERRVLLQSVTRQVAEVELAQTHEQIHVLSRAPVVVPCEDSAVAQVVAEAPSASGAAGSEVIVLLGDVLFQSGKASLNDISTPARGTLDVVIARFKTEYERIDSIKVLGHSDPFGKQERKQIYSAELADAVRDYFLANGLQSIRIVSEGRSDKELVVKDCGNTKTNANMLCNSPNRRVAIEVTGVRRTSP